MICKMKKLTLLAALGLGMASVSAQAAVVECLISGTPTPQEFTPQFCSSQASSPATEVIFRLTSSKPIAEVTWNYSGTSGRWDCRKGQYCVFSNSTREPSGSAEACATRVLYKDGTWENLNSCAYGMFWYGSGPVITPFTHDVTEEQLNASSEQF